MRGYDYYKPLNNMQYLVGLGIDGNDSEALDRVYDACGKVALMQYREFCGLSNAKICSIIADFTQVISHYIERSATFAVLPVNALNRDGLIDLATWDAMPTIFPFILYKNQKPLSRAQTLVCYHQLPLQEIPCQIGQPVVCGEIEGIELICIHSIIINHPLFLCGTSRVFNRYKIKWMIPIKQLLKTFISSNLIHSSLVIF